MPETISKLTCTRCGHSWYPRTTNKPKFCASCNSPYWAKPRRICLDCQQDKDRCPNCESGNLYRTPDQNKINEGDN